MSDPGPLSPTLVPLPGGHSGRTFMSEVAGERAVVRVYPPGDPRGPAAPEIDEALLRLVRGLLPVPTVLDVRREQAGDGLPGLLVTSWMPGERGDLVVAGLDDRGLRRLGMSMGRTAAVLAGMPMLRPGPFEDAELRLGRFPDVDLAAWVDTCLTRWSDDDRSRLAAVADRAQDLLDDEPRACLVHSDLNPKNVL
ncbi:MAG TPA: aminoglycoside phosphotransferase family protein, partial [Nocardioides sp.]